MLFGLVFLDFEGVMISKAEDAPSVGGFFSGIHHHITNFIRNSRESYNEVSLTV